MQWRVNVLNITCSLDINENQDKLNQINDNKTQKTINEIYNINIKEVVSTQSPTKSSKKTISKDFKKYIELKPQKPIFNKNSNT